MSVPEEPVVHNEVTGPTASQFVQAGHVTGGVHFHAPPPPPQLPLDLWLVLAGVVGVAAGLGAIVLAFSSGGDGLPPLTGTGLRDTPETRRPLEAKLLVIGYFAFSALWAALDLFDRRSQARGRDRFVGRAALWLSFIPVFGALTFAGVLPGTWTLLYVPAAVAAAIAVLRALSGGFRARWGFAVAAGAGATLWFVPEVMLLWRLGPVLWQVLGTVLLLGIVAVPVLAVLVGPAKRGTAMLRSWVWGLVVKLVLTMSILMTTEPSHDYVTTLVLPLCAVPVMLVVAVVLSDSDTRAERRASAREDAA